MKLAFTVKYSSYLCLNAQHITYACRFELDTGSQNATQQPMKHGYVKNCEVPIPSKCWVQVRFGYTWIRTEKYFQKN